MDSQTRIERNIALGEVEPMISVREANAKLASLRQQVKIAREALETIKVAYTWNSSTFQCLQYAQQTASDTLKLMDHPDERT